jgi:prepilin-type N-terminal cleavage/methylation domain-containing protein
MILSAFYPKHLLVKKQSGFSLIEMAIVMVILGALLGGLITPLSSQREANQRQATERQLQEIRNALIGFAQVNNRLPCPVSAANQGVEQATPCSPLATNFFVPYVTLGLQGTIVGTPGTTGQLADAWQQPIIYRLTPVTAWEYARSILLAPTLAPDFQICSTSTGATATVCANGRRTATAVVAVLFSTGPNGANGPAVGDETENTNTNPVFVANTPRINFDDIMVWISQSSLTFELSRAGQ